MKQREIRNGALKNMSLLYGIILLIIWSASSCNVETEKYFFYSGEGITLDDSSVRDSLVEISLKELPERTPSKKFKLVDATPFTERLWDIALTDVESNIILLDSGQYFGAGKNFGSRIYTRDISYSGILGLNKLYPEEILRSIKLTRELRLNLGFKVAKGMAVSDIPANWIAMPLTENEFLLKYNTNSYTRRTDDVVWLWAVLDLFENNPNLAQWEWLYENGSRCFNELYEPFFDTTDHLYRGQASFVDIHFTDRKATGYPQHFSVGDCIALKALSTNCLYVQGMRAMSIASQKLGKMNEAKYWMNRADNLKMAILTNLTLEDGTLSYFKNLNGDLEQKNDALGTALAVLSGVVNGEKARKCLDALPVTSCGVPLFQPFYQIEKSYHNNTSWPFVDTFFLWAKEKAEGEDYTGINAALLARTCVDGGSFHEYLKWNTKAVSGSSSQLWSAAAFINVCDRKGIVRSMDDSNSTL